MQKSEIAKISCQIGILQVSEIARFLLESEASYKTLRRPAYYVHTTQLLPHPGHEL